MHELGHILLDSEDEFAANVFASNILAPRIAIQYSCKNYKEVMNLFALSEEAANIAFNDYRRWRLYIVNHNNKMSEIDMALYNHFYNKKVRKFVYKSNECLICGRKMYNTFDKDCGICTLPRYTYPSYNELDRQLIVAENTWLYGE
jgi:ribosomal protein L37E